MIASRRIYVLYAVFAVELLAATVSPVLLIFQRKKHFVAQNYSSMSDKFVIDHSHETESHLYAFATLNDSNPTSSPLLKLQRSHKRAPLSPDALTVSKSYKNFTGRILQSYDKNIRPDFGAKPTLVRVGIDINTFRSISEAEMEYSLEFELLQQWHDARLKFDPCDFANRDRIALSEQVWQLIWKPDSIIMNSVKALQARPGSMAFRQHGVLFSTGLIQHKQKMLVVASCFFDLMGYPFDQQKCRITLTSNGFAATEIVYKWNITNALNYNGGNYLPDFYLETYIPKMTNITYRRGNHSGLEVCFVLSRLKGYCIIQLLFPSTVVLAASWIPLWLDEQMFFRDIINIMLSILFLSYSYNQVMPKVSYLKGMDIYLGAALLFVFIALAKMALIKHMQKKAKKKISKHLQAEDDVEHHVICEDPNENEVDDSWLSHHSLLEAGRQHIHEFAAVVSKRIHRGAWANVKAVHIGSQIALPLAFVAFCIFFYFVFPATFEPTLCH